MDQIPNEKCIFFFFLSLPKVGMAFKICWSETKLPGASNWRHKTEQLPMAARASSRTGTPRPGWVAFSDEESQAGQYKHCLYSQVTRYFVGSVFWYQTWGKKCTPWILCWWKKCKCKYLF